MTTVFGVELFDDEANAARPGWRREEGLQRVEWWTRKAGGCIAWVMGSPSADAGYWQFVVMAGDDLMTRGESSRRGWAMDGADAAISRTLN